MIADLPYLILSLLIGLLALSLGTAVTLMIGWAVSEAADEIDNALVGVAFTALGFLLAFGMGVATIIATLAFLL